MMSASKQMQFGLNIPPFDDLADPRALVDLAHEAESAGWDGFFIWDHMIFDDFFCPMVDPWIGLAAVAMRTSRIRLGTMITPLARRRPWKVARETVSLDQLSGGRVILGVGLGDPVQWEFGFFGEEVDARVRADRLDEGLAILNGLWSGEPFAHKGQHYTLEEMIFLPRPVQTPRIPIWVGGWWPNKRPMRRAARWDGVCPGKWDGPLTPDDWRDILAYIDTHRDADGPFDAVHSGVTPDDDPAGATDIVGAYAEAGVTWWIEDMGPGAYSLEWSDPTWFQKLLPLMRARILAGPPKI